ncbi:NADH dehydrogenase (ubiquinone) 1 alpha subcomplex [Musa troglodytarum]|uniref:NADH dehydrogenase (Ubiquinone) 1 alpha subcomplex n=1 Tax=Musa troglodytarum TaxID=320322 RepID=A0A9E7EPW6_9LILI|nr:NADH dehydrogenase (ubiquinone) 1 alpha subcomplex [Musa troglodytarum]URD79788.1 NADH dehydrogenase (ubiquinone) 1 alpha subcomplex [Musa troglodytarum]
MGTSAAAAAISGAPNLSSLLRHQIVKPVQVPPPCARSFHVRRRTAWRRASSSTPPPPPAAEAASPGLYSAKVYELTKENVNLVLDDVRPYLISDGGNVDVVSVEDGVISLQLQGACGSCPSSTTTMKMGIERVLKEKFGEAVKDICQVEGIQIETTVEAVNNHLEILRPAIKNFGGSVEVVSVEAGDCSVRYTGPDSIGRGIKAAIKEKFPDIINVVFI